jgi:hypothetical protein
MNCPQCGADTHQGQKFCARCGSPLTSTPTSPAQPELPPPPSQEALWTAPPAPHPSPGEWLPDPNYRQPAIAPIPTRTRSRLPFIIGAVAAVILFPIIVLSILLLTRPGASITANTTPTATVLAGETAATSVAVEGTVTVEPTEQASTTAEAQVDPTTVAIENTLNLASKAMESVQTMRYRSEVGFFGVNSSSTTITDTTSLTITLKGDIALPANFSLDSNLPQLGDYVTIGDDTWKRTSDADPWTPQSTDASSLGLVNPLTFASYLSYYQPGTVQLISTDTQGGQTIQRIRFEVDTVSMAASTNDPSTRQALTNGRVNVNAWVRAGDYRLDRITLSVETLSGAGVIIRTTFSGYNDAIDIKPPVTTSP